MIEYHLLLARHHGAATGYPVRVSYGDIGPVRALYEELSNHPGLAEFQKEHAEILFISNGAVLHQHDLPNPATIERQRLNRVLAEARAIDAAHKQAAVELAATSQRLADARAALKQLSPEQKELLKREADAQAAADKAAGEAKATADKAAADKAAAAAQAAADAKAAEDLDAAAATAATQAAAAPPPLEGSAPSLPPPA